LSGVRVQASGEADPAPNREARDLVTEAVGDRGHVSVVDRDRDRRVAGGARAAEDRVRAMMAVQKDQSPKGRDLAGMW